MLYNGPRVGSLHIVAEARMRRITERAVALSLSIASMAAGQNLVTNGGFESGSTGWTTWRAPWGAGEVWDFNNTQAGLVGAKCLKISTTGQSSFGVYQQI